MSELIDKLRLEFQDEDYRHSYAEECLNTMIATQIKVLREQQEMTQSALANKSGMLQPRLSVMEDANYSSWSVSTLKRLARAFDLALSVKFESFSEVVMDFEELSKETLARPSFKKDPLFRSSNVRAFRRVRGSRNTDAERNALQGSEHNSLVVPGEIVKWPSQALTVEHFPIIPAQKVSSEQKGEPLYAASISAFG